MMDQEQKKEGISIILISNTEGAKKVFDIPAARRLALLCAQIGFGEIHIVGNTDTFNELLADLTAPDGFHPVEDRKGLDDAANAILTSRPRPEGGKILVMRADLVVDKANLQTLALMSAEPKIPCLVSDGNGAGIFQASSRNLAAVMKHAWTSGGNGRGDSSAGSRNSHSTPASDAGLKALASVEPITAGDPCLEFSILAGLNGLPYALKDPGSDKIAERKLIGAIRDQTKATDGFMSRHVSRHVSLLMSTRLALTRVTPNQVTLVGAGIGLLGAFFIAQGGYWEQLAGCLLFLLCIIIDGVDGEIARLKLQESEFGHKLDIITDNIVHIAIFFGLAAGCYRQTGNHLYLQLLAVLMGGFALCGVTVYLRLLRPAVENFRFPALGRLLNMMSNRDFAYLMVLLAVVGRLHWFLIGAAFGSYVFAAVLWMATGAEKPAPTPVKAGPGMRIR